MVGGVDHVEIVVPTPCGDRRDHPAQRLVDQLALDGVAGVDLAHLIRRQCRRHPVGRGFVVGDQAAFVPGLPVAGLGIEHRLALPRILDVAGRQWHVAPIDATELRRRRVPRMMWIGEAHPAEPVVVGTERVEPRDRAIGDPVGVVPLPRHGVVVHLRRSRLTATGGADLQGRVEHREEHRHRLRMVGGHPPRVVQRAKGAMRCGLEVLEAAMQPDRFPAGEAVLGEAGERVEEGLEVRLADQRGAVSVVVQHRSDRGRVDGEGDAVHPHAVRARMLAGDDGRARWHADDGLRMGTLVAVAPCREPVDHRSTCNAAAVAAERVVPLLIAGHQQDLATHQRAPSGVSASICRLSSSSAPAVAPPIVNAMARGSASVEYTTRQVSSPRSITSIPPRW